MWRIRKVDKDFARKFGFKDIKFLVKITDIQKIEKINCISISAFGYENKEKFPIYVSKNTFKRHVYLLLTEKGQSQTKDFSTSMYHQTLTSCWKEFLSLLLAIFTITQILKRHANECFKINNKKMIKMAKNGQTVKFKNYARIIKSSFMSHVDF